jgi:hypothetical protein
LLNKAFYISNMATTSSATMVWLLLLALTTRVSVSAESATVTTIPLIPHHALAQRRRHLLQQLPHQEEQENLEEDENFRRPFRRLAGGAQQVGALYQGYGTHYVDLWCGTPPQRQTVIVDTGSGVTAFPCEDCDDCGAPKYHIDNYFFGSESSTYKKMHCDSCMRGQCREHDSEEGGQCVISMSYQEGSSWKAFEAKDLCYIGGPHNTALVKDTGVEDIDPNHASHFAFDMVFGCQSSLTGLFKTQLADGIMGMDNGRQTFWQQMYNSGKMGPRKQFSLCFGHQTTAAREGSEAGAMSLGGYDDRLHDTPLVWSTGTNDHSGFFDVVVRAVYLREGIGGESSMSASPDAKIIKLDMTPEQLNIDSVIVDSGTTDTYWNQNIESRFVAAFKELTGDIGFSEKSMALTDEQFAKLPTILFQLNGDATLNGALAGADSNGQVVGLAGSVDPDHPLDVLLAFPPSHYMEYSKKSGKYSIRFSPSEFGGSVLGANAMMGHDVVFDVSNNRLGWTESSCDYTQLVTGNGYPSVLGDETTEVAAQVQTVKEEVVEPTVTGDKPPVVTEKPVVVTEKPVAATEKPVAATEKPVAAMEKPVAATEKTVAQPSKETLPNPAAPKPKDASSSTSADDATDKKKVPISAKDTHEEQVPDDDIKKQFSSLVGVCASTQCEGAAFAAVVSVVLLGMCVGRCCCSGGRRKPQLYQRANTSEMELPKGRFSSYKDDPVDAEFGDLDDDKDG